MIDLTTPGPAHVSAVDFPLVRFSGTPLAQVDRGWLHLREAGSSTTLDLDRTADRLSFDFEKYGNCSRVIRVELFHRGTRVDTLDLTGCSRGTVSREAPFDRAVIRIVNGTNLEALFATDLRIRFSETCPDRCGVSSFTDFSSYRHNTPLDRIEEPGMSFSGTGPALAGDFLLIIGGGSQVFVDHDQRAERVRFVFDKQAAYRGSCEAVATIELFRDGQLVDFAAYTSCLEAGVFASEVPHDRMVITTHVDASVYGYEISAGSLCVPGDDTDFDGTTDAADVCPIVPDDQGDADANGTGDACECGDATGDGHVDISDIVAINAAIFDPDLEVPLCDTNDDGLCDVADILGVQARIFGSPAHCSANPRTP